MWCCISYLYLKFIPFIYNIHMKAIHMKGFVLQLKNRIFVVFLVT